MKIYPTLMIMNLVMYKAMNRIRQYFHNRRERKRLKDEAWVKAGFKVEERNGYLWLTHEGVAFMKVNSVAYAADAVKELLMARETAIEYKGL